MSVGHTDNTFLRFRSRSTHHNQTSADGNQTTSTLSISLNRTDAGKYLSCKAYNSYVPSAEALEDGWKLDIQCKLFRWCCSLQCDYFLFRCVQMKMMKVKYGMHGETFVVVWIVLIRMTITGEHVILARTAFVIPSFFWKWAFVWNQNMLLPQSILFDSLLLDARLIRVSCGKMYGRKSISSILTQDSIIYKFSQLWNPSSS